jgi:hypothetical protein
MSKKTPSKNKSKSSGKASPLTSPGGVGRGKTPGTSSTPASPFREANADGSYSFGVLFQARSAASEGGACPGQACLLAPADMRRMQLFAGSCVAVRLGGGGTVLLLRALPSPKTLPGSLVLSRLWSSNFSDQYQSSSRKVAAKSDFGR